MGGVATWWYIMYAELDKDSARAVVFVGDDMLWQFANTCKTPALTVS